ncbi:olfactory receptor 14A2-like [Tachyglossus aculeatus]|uniref:olfactory receptor 14A2-like n=1 Tax=Tachyglossus aculeatus TaxID=9261 RepID=UPI0018F61037|nr:olfactory receptor 14A2-like [Tachyglossus aculeatus]
MPVQELWLAQAVLFLLVYLTALTGNHLIVAVNILDRRLHTPIEISLLACAAQVFLVVFLAVSEMSLLMMMCYDRYAAICQPLRYDLIMDRGACGKMAAASWLNGGLFGAMYSAGIFKLSFCESNVIQQFFCDVPALLKNSCSETHVVIDVSVDVGIGFGSVSFVSLVVSYVRIFLAVLRFPSTEMTDYSLSLHFVYLIVDP